jgi:branched-chain amino acid transport system ATP-binding protein
VGPDPQGHRGVSAAGEELSEGGLNLAEILCLSDVQVFYDRAIHVLKGVSLAVPEKGMVALLGANGAGKSTTLKAVSNLFSAERGQVAAGEITFLGRSVVGRDPADLVRLGIAQVMEGRRLFAHLTVEENLRSAARAGSGASIKADLDKVYGYFPRLAERRNLKSGYLSGGEQQMTAIGRALMARPKLMLLDEPSMGLAPLLVKEIFEILRALNQQEGVSILLAEQNANMALATVHYGYVLEGGMIACEGPADELRARRDIQTFYLGLSTSDHDQSYRQILLKKRAAVKSAGAISNDTASG